ncbi:MAG: hypothetical protein MI975_00160 [Cytophagales bacterium]|nr:hypothetical protein [Cytophagales bacterium]
MKAIIDKINQLARLVVFGVLALACESQEDTFSEFVKNGETIYIGKADTVSVAPGFKKLRFSVALNADPKISKGWLESTDGSVGHEFDVNRTKNGKDTVTFDLELEEGEYTFSLYLMDDAGHRSIRSEVPARVFGEKYQASLLNRGIKNIEAFADGSAKISWSTPGEGIIETMLNYEDADGNTQTMPVSNDETKTVIASCKLGGKIQVSSTYKPIENAIDAFGAIPFETTFPTLFQLDKNNFAVIKLANDIAGTKAGGSLTKLYDGNIGGNNFYHSDPKNDPMPQHFTLDLGVSSNIAEIEIYGRTGGKSSIEKNPRILEIWGINDLAGAETMLPSNDPGWEQESLDKGWVKLAEITHPDDLNNAPTDYIMTVADQSPSVRYIRFVVKATWRADKKASHLTEISVKSSKIN